jgi:CheY-like chemotaxis protein
MPKIRPTVAVFNDNSDTLSVISTWLEVHGIRTVNAQLPNMRRGHEDVLAFLAKYVPNAIVFDVGMPYEPNWDFLGVIRLMPESALIPIVVTTSNKTALERLVGESGAVELHGKPADLNELLREIERVSAGRSVAS